MGTVTDRLTLEAGARPRRGRLGRGFTYVCWRRPPALSDEGKRALYGEIIKVASSTFGDDMTPYWTRRAADGYLEKITRVFLIMLDGRVVGWTGYHRLKVAGQTCLFIDATGVLPELQKTGVMTQVFGRLLAAEFARNRLRPLYLAMRTESPVVYKAFLRIVGEADIYPNLLKPAPPVVEEIGRYIAGWLHQSEKFEPATLRILNAFDGPCPWRWTGNADEEEAGHPLCGDARVNSYFLERLRPEDAFIIIARMTASAGVKLLGRALAKSAVLKPLSRRKGVREGRVKV